MFLKTIFGKFLKILDNLYMLKFSKKNLFSKLNENNLICFNKVLNGLDDFTR